MSMDQIERLCEGLYRPPASMEEKLEVEKQLNMFKQSPDFLTQSVSVLQHSPSPPTQHIIAVTMTNVITERWNQFKDGQKSVELRNWIIQFLGFRGNSLESYVLSSVVQVNLS